MLTCVGHLQVQRDKITAQGCKNQPTNQSVKQTDKQNVSISLQARQLGMT